MTSLDVAALPEAAALLAGRTVLVTGAGSADRMAGVGAATALRCAQAGASVVILERDAARAAHTADAVRAVGRAELLCVAGDITDAGSVAAAIDAVGAWSGRIDVLVNSAGISPDESGGTSLDTWDRVLEVNLRAAKIMLDAVLPVMRRQGSGTVVNISSLAATRGGGGVAYSASKGALESLSRATAAHEGRYGIRVNSISPGHLLSPMGLEGANGLGGAEGAQMLRARRAAASLLRREGTAWDVADAVLFLASDAARFITGTTLEVDGGAGSVMPLSIWQAIAEGAADVG